MTDHFGSEPLRHPLGRRWFMAAIAGGLLAAPAATAQRERIAELAARSRLPTMFALKLHVDSGGLMSYGADIFYLYRRTAI